MFDIGSNLERVKDEATEKIEKVSGTLDNVVQNASESLENLNIGKRLDDTASRAKEIASTAWDEHVADVSFDSEKIERESKEAFRHVDTMYMAENIKTPEAVSNLSAADLLDDLKDKSLDATYAAASYFAAGQYALADGVSAVGDKVKSLELDEKVKTGVDKLYSASEIASKFASEYGVGSDKFEQTKNELVVKTVETGKAVAYMSGRFAAGAASVVDRAGRTVYGMSLYRLGEQGKAAEVMTTSKIDDFRQAVDDAFDPDEYQQTVGDVVDASGQFVAESALAIVAMANIPTTATAGGIAAAALAGKTAAVEGAIAVTSLNAAGNSLEKNIAKSGEFGDKEYVAATVAAGATVLTSRLVPFVNGKLLAQGSIERTASKIIKTGVEEKIGARITGSLSLAAVSGLDAGLIKSSQEISKITDYALGLDESFDAKKEALETLGTVAGAAALGGASYFAADTIRNSERFAKIAEKFTGKEYMPQMEMFDKAYRGELIKEGKFDLTRIGMTPQNIEKCVIDNEGVVHLNTINDDLAGMKHPVTGIEYKKKQIEVDGVTIEGVFPDFKSEFTCYLDRPNLRASDEIQFKDCMAKLRDAVDNDSSLAEKFTPREIEQIHDEDVSVLSNYTWHHNEELGKMELVRTDVHGMSGHTGGKSIWGGGHK